MANLKFTQNQSLTPLFLRVLILVNYRAFVLFMRTNALSVQRFTRLFAVLSTVLSVSACSTVGNINESMPWFSGNDVESVGLMVKFDAQLQHAISVDVVFAYDENLVALLSNATATQWFTQKSGYIASYGQNMDIVHREIVPGYSEHITQLPERHSDAKAVVAFAWYPNDPTTLAVLTTLPTPWLLFDAQKMTLSQTMPQASVGGQ